MSGLPRGGIGTMNEMSLHSALKMLYYEPGDCLEGQLGRFVVDVVKPDRVVEIQSGSFASIRQKLTALLEQHVVHLVYPVAAVKYIVHISPETGEEISRRKSPKRGALWDVFSELVYIPKLITHPHLHLDVIFIVEEEVRCADGRGSWRRSGVSIVDRRVVEVVGHHVLSAPEHYSSLLPESLPSPFSNQELGKELGISTAWARTVTYTLREAGIIHQAGKSGSRLLYVSPS